MDNHDDIALAGGYRKGRGRTLLSYTVLSITFFPILLLLFLPSCSPRIVERVVYQHDTTQVVRIDSIWQYQHDSVYVREKGDTVYKYVEKIRYRDRFRIDTLVSVRELHDTTVVERKVDKPLSKIQKAKIGAFWWLLAGLAACLGWIFRKPLLAIIRKWLPI